MGVVELEAAVDIEGEGVMAMEDKARDVEGQGNIGGPGEDGGRDKTIGVVGMEEFGSEAIEASMAMKKPTQSEVEMVPRFSRSEREVVDDEGNTQGGGQRSWAKII